MGRPLNTPGRILAKIRRTDSCWDWTGTIKANGYGQVSINYRSEMAHRAVYEILVGPIPDGMQIDHICRNLRCVNPDHLEAVTPRTNTLRSLAITAIHARKRRCVHGHEFTSENTYTPPSGVGRHCKQCRRERKAGLR